MSNISSGRILLAALSLSTAAPALAQNTTAPQTLPGLDNFSLPPSRPTVTPTTVPTPAPTPTPTAAAPIAPVATSTPAARPSPRGTPVATPTPAPSATAAPVETVAPAPVVPTPVPTATATPTIAPTPAASATPVERDGGSWLVPIGIGAILGGLAVFLVSRRRRPPVEPVVRQTRRRADPDPVAVPDAPALPAAPPVSRAQLSMSLRPARAGLNMITATVEGEITVTNEGDAPAEAIRLAMVLLAAGARQDVALAEVYSRPIGRPVTPPFALAPGESRTVRAVAALSRDVIEPLVAGGRPMFVPLAATTCLYETAGERAQTSQAFVVGVERIDSAKLAPFWLDAAPKSHDQVAARPQGPVVKR